MDMNHPVEVGNGCHSRSDGQVLSFPRKDRWIPYIKNNPYLSKEEQEEWIRKLSKQP